MSQSCQRLLNSFTSSLALLLVLLISPLAFAHTHTPTTAAELTAVLNGTSIPALQLGDTIVLNAGTTYTGTFTLPNLTTGTGYVTIESSALASLPAAGERVFPADAADMPKVQAPCGNTRAIRTSAGAHHYKLIGLEIIAPADNSTLTAVIDLGTSGTAQDTIEEIPHNLIIDRCVIRANSSTQTVRRGIALNSASTDIINSYIYDFKDAGTDAQAIGGWNGPGPYNITNNYLEAAAEAILFGGSTPTVPDLVPSDIVVSRNYFHKNPNWNGTSWLIKNHFELKAGRRVTIDGNVMQRSWNGAGGQAGKAITFKCVRQSGQGAAWTAVEDLTVTNNRVFDCGIGVAFGGNTDTTGAGMNGWPKTVTIRNNLFYNVTNTMGSGFFMQILQAPENVTFDHNTAFATNAICTVDGPAVPGFVYTNNMTNRGTYGFKGTGTASGRNTFNTWFSTMIWAKNVLAIAGSSSPTSNYLPEWAGGWELSPFNNGNLGYPTTWSGVLQNQATPGTDFAGYKVVGWDQPTNTSLYPYNNTSTDGKDIGCDIDVMNAATAGCISGVWGSPPAPPAAPGNLVATPSSDTQINLTWADNSSDETNFELDRAIDSSFTSNLVTTTLGANVTSAPATGLAASTTYYFRVRATNAGGGSAYSNTASATTLAGSPPDAPSNLVATTASSSQINLSWSDNSGNETNFELDRATNDTFTSNLLTTTLGSDVTSAQATGLLPSTTYYFRVRATNPSGASAYSSTASATTDAPPSESILQQNVTGGGDSGEAKGGATLSQSFVHPGSGAYEATKVTIHISRKQQLPTANLVVSLGTGHASGTIAGSTVNVTPATVTNTSAGSSWQTLDVVFAAPVTLNKGTTYYVNLTSTTAGGKPYYLDVSSSDTYSGGAYTGAGGGSRDMWFQVWGQ